MIDGGVLIQVEMQVLLYFAIGMILKKYGWRARGRISSFRSFSWGLSCP